MEKWTAGRLAAAVDRTARAGGRSNARDEALTLVERVNQEVGAGASAEEVASAVVLRATQGGSGVVRVARVKGGDEVVLGVNPEVLREVCRMLKAGAGDEAPGSRAEHTFAVEVLDAEEAVAAEFGQVASSQLSAGHAARLVVGWIRERAAVTDNKRLVQMLKKLGVVKNEQFQRQFLAAFFPTRNRGGRREARDAQLDALLDALEQGCEALLSKGGYTRGGARPFLLDVQEAMHLLTVAAKHASSDEEALEALRGRLSEVEEAATDEKRLKKLLSFRKSAAGEAEQEAEGLTSHLRRALGQETFRRLAGEAMASVVDRLDTGEKGRICKVLDAVFVCAAKRAGGEDEERHDDDDNDDDDDADDDAEEAAGSLERLRRMCAEWRAGRRQPAQQTAARRRSQATAAVAGAAQGTAGRRSFHRREGALEVEPAAPAEVGSESEALSSGGEAAGAGATVSEMAKTCHTAGEAQSGEAVGDAAQHAPPNKEGRRTRESAGGEGDSPARGTAANKRARVDDEAATRSPGAPCRCACPDSEEPGPAVAAGGACPDVAPEEVAAPAGTSKTPYMTSSSSS